jgi:hypothetical protein
LNAILVDPQVDRPRGSADNDDLSEASEPQLRSEEAPCIRVAQNARLG